MIVKFSIRHHFNGITGNYEIPGKCMLPFPVTSRKAWNEWKSWMTFAYDSVLSRMSTEMSQQM